MTTVLEYIERLRLKPHAERQRIAVGTSLGISVFIAFVWLATSLSTGAFKVQGTSFAAAAASQSPAVVAGGADSSNIAGAAAAVSGDNSGPPTVQVVDAPAPAAKQPEATVIPF